MDIPKILKWIVILILLYAAVYTSMCYALPRIFGLDFQLWGLLPGSAQTTCGVSRD